MLRVLPIAAAIPLLLAYGAAEGVWTNRWQTSRAAEEAAGRLARVPLQVGEWVGEEQALEARAVARAEVSGYRMRKYVHRPSGAAVTVLLVCGPPGPVSVHAPEVCFGGAGLALTAPPVRHTLADDSARPAAFWVGKFQRSAAAVPERLRAFWAWTATGDWVAADRPRLEFARAPVLFKLYVLRPVADFNEPLDTDPAVTFLRQFLPEVQTSLFPAAPAE